MSKTDDGLAFFEDIQAAAVLKHGILRRYLRIFVSIAGSSAPQGQVSYLDAYAGPGTYTDGTPGSPALAVATAEEVSKISTGRTLRGVCIEADRELFRRLQELMARYPNWVALRGTVETHFSKALEEYVGIDPLFAFFDPFGLGVPFDTVLSLLGRPQGSGAQRVGPITEVLLNFSVPGLVRNAGHLTSPKDYPAKERFIEKVNRSLGGDWWQEIWTAGSSNRAGLIASEYVKRLRQRSQAGWGFYLLDVSDRPGSPPVYYLIFLSQSPEALWHFNDALSLAVESDYLPFCERADSQGRLDLEPTREQLVESVKSNIRRMLEGGRPFKVAARASEVYGDTLGEAREKDVRAALKELFAEGVTSTDPTAKRIAKLWVHPR